MFGLPIPDHAFFEQPLFVLSHLAHHFAPSNGDGARLNGTNARRARNLQDDKILLDHPNLCRAGFGEPWGRPVNSASSVHLVPVGDHDLFAGQHGQSWLNND